jgi:hypothetical protein
MLVELEVRVVTVAACVMVTTSTVGEPGAL